MVQNHAYLLSSRWDFIKKDNGTSSQFGLDHKQIKKPLSASQGPLLYFTLVNIYGTFSACGKFLLKLLPFGEKQSEPVGETP